MTGVLFVCTANACRSQMAEGFARSLLGPGVQVFSAGTRPTAVDPRAVQVMGELGLDLSGQRASALAEVPLELVSHVITLCADAADHCPRLPGKRHDHWPLTDPAAAQGSPDDVLRAFRTVRDDLRSRIQTLAAALERQAAAERDCGGAR